MGDHDRRTVIGDQSAEMIAARSVMSFRVPHSITSSDGNGGTDRPASPEIE
jgi:hypothetical protein